MISSDTTDMHKNKLNIETRKVDDLIPYALNNRKHPPAQIAALASTIREVGFRNPIHIESNGTIIAGHGRLLAAQKLGIAEVPVIVHRDITEREARILRIADNRLAELSVIDGDNLQAELKDLLLQFPDSVTLTGYSQSDIDALTNAAVEILDGEDIPKDERSGASPWDRVTPSDSIRCIVGDIEFGIPKAQAEQFASFCKDVGPTMREGAAAWFALKLLG